MQIQSYYLPFSISPQTALSYPRVALKACGYRVIIYPWGYRVIIYPFPFHPRRFSLIPRLFSRLVDYLGHLQCLFPFLLEAFCHFSGWNFLCQCARAEIKGERKIEFREFPGGPVVRILQFHC